MKKIFLWMFCVSLIAGCQMLGDAQKSEEKTEIIANINAILERGIKEADEKVSKDPKSPSAFILSQLRETKRYVDQVEGEEVEFNVEEMLYLTQKTMALVENLKQEFKLVLNADVAFQLGGFEPDDLLEGGQEILDRFAERIVNSQLAEYRKAFPAVTLLVVVSTKGYADEVGQGRRLTDELMKFAPAPLPEEVVERRRFLNEILSVRRSQTINAYVRNQIEAKLKGANVQMGEPIVEGFGEEYPENPEEVDPPYRKEDMRRRICKVYSNILIK